MNSHLSISLGFVSASLLIGLLASLGCEPRHPTNTPDQAMATATTVATTPVTTQPNPYPTVTTTQPTAYPYPTTAPTVATTPATPATTAWPTANSGTAGGFDPAVLADIARKAAAGLGIALPNAGTAPTAPTGNPLDTLLQTNASKYAPGFSPATPVGRATLKTGEHAGMNIDMVPGKCYVLLAVGGAGVTQLGLHMLVPATPPNVPVASDTAHGNAPVVGEGRPLCPPVKTTVRVDAVIMQGAGDVAVQVWQK